MKRIFFIRNVSLCLLLAFLITSCEVYGTGEGKTLDTPYSFVAELLTSTFAERCKLFDQTVQMGDVKKFLDICFQKSDRVNLAIIRPNTDDAGMYTEEYMSMSEDEQFIWFKTVIKRSMDSPETPIAEGYLICKTNPETNKTYIVRFGAKPY